MSQRKKKSIPSPKPSISGVVIAAPLLAFTANAFTIEVVTMSVWGLGPATVTVVLCVSGHTVSHSASVANQRMTVKSRLS